MTVVCCLCVGLVTRPEASCRVWCVWVWSWSLDNVEALAHWGLLRHKKILYSYFLYWNTVFSWYLDGLVLQKDNECQGYANILPPCAKWLSATVRNGPNNGPSALFIRNQQPWDAPISSPQAINLISGSSIHTLWTRLYRWQWGTGLHLMTATGLSKQNKTGILRTHNRSFRAVITKRRRTEYNIKRYLLCMGYILGPSILRRACVFNNTAVD